ncbi:MAG: type II toxin-antitoxin system VapC family toxin [Chloroflexota bacterium]
MRLLLDTHAFIWLESEPDKLSSDASDAITDAKNTVLLSLVNVWEIQIKIGLGKMTLNGSLPDVVARQQEKNGLILLSVTANHIYELANIGNHHRDPFDRLLIAQARYEGMALVTADPQVQAYTVTTLW